MFLDFLQRGSKPLSNDTIQALFQLKFDGFIKLESKKRHFAKLFSTLGGHNCHKSKAIAAFFGVLGRECIKPLIRTLKRIFFLGYCVQLFS